MKKNKKLVMALSFCVGVALFGTTVFADIAARTGYDEFKDAVKNTFQNCSKSYQNFTLEGYTTIKDNDKILASVNSLSKYDNVNKRSLDTGTTEMAGGSKANTLFYRDQYCSLWYNNESDTYYISEFTKKNEHPIFENPFENDRAKDIEKIADALIGNLKDYIIINDKTDGSKELSASLSETQIPALINAVISFGFKQEASSRNMRNNEPPIPQLKDDIFIKNLNTKVALSEEGVIESILATGTLSGKDEQAVSHDLTVEILLKLSDINSTLVEKPDLNGKKVEKSTQTPFDEKTISKKFIGTYKNDIVVEKENAFVKLGERFVVISGIDGKSITGKYYEVYKDEYKEQYAGRAVSFDFTAEIQNPYSAQFTYKEKGYNLSEIYFDSNGSQINLGGSAPDRFNYGFSRVFD
ncbi:MAG: hypothetical protein N3I35_05300 [Clostridia bacterium]|nr:hypothetical protein [Clostridia bacterium]